MMKTNVSVNREFLQKFFRRSFQSLQKISTGGRQTTKKKKNVHELQRRRQVESGEKFWRQSLPTHRSLAVAVIINQVSHLHQKGKPVSSFHWNLALVGSVENRMGDRLGKRSLQPHASQNYINHTSGLYNESISTRLEGFSLIVLFLLYQNHLNWSHSASDQHGLRNRKGFWAAETTTLNTATDQVNCQETFPWLKLKIRGTLWFKTCTRPFLSTRLVNCNLPAR